MTITKDNILAIANEGPVTEAKILEKLKAPSDLRHLARLQTLISKLKQQNKLLYFVINDEVYYEANCLPDSDDTY